MTPAAFDDRINDRTALASIGVTEKQPILLSESGRSDRILNQVIVDLDFGFFEVNFQCSPLGQCVTDSFAHWVMVRVHAGETKDRSARQLSREEGCVARTLQKLRVHVRDFLVFFMIPCVNNDQVVLRRNRRMGAAGCEVPWGLAE